jgi:hypothetical protein
LEYFAYEVLLFGFRFLDALEPGKKAFKIPLKLEIKVLGAVGFIAGLGE